MKHSKYLIIISILIFVIMLLSACGEKGTESTADESKTAETTVVLETTLEGGTVEQDSEGNRITKDSEGKVTKVEDKDGNPIKVEEYLTTHTWVENPGSNDSGSVSHGGSSDGSSGNSSGSISNGSSSGSTGNSGGSVNKNPNNSQDDNIEESIPVVIATVPDEDDMEVLPDL